jgi:hypothetical protein
MRGPEIQRLIDAVEALHGLVALYGSEPTEEHGTCFKIAGAPATFSVHTREGELPPGQYDIQIEGVPPGEYVYTSVVSLETFLKLVARMKGPEVQWP